MTASEIAPDPRRYDRRRRHVGLATASATAKLPDRKHLGCGDVARKRAARYARQHRISKPFWPIIAAFILVGVIFERRPFPAFFRTDGKTASDGVVMGRASMPGLDDKPDTGRAPDPLETGSAISGDPEPRYRPPSDFLATETEVAQIVAFLVRNRGKAGHRSGANEVENPRSGLPAASRLSARS